MVIRPPRAVPVTESRSMPSAAATRRATGEALAAGAGAGVAPAELSAALGAGAVACPPLGADGGAGRPPSDAPAVMRPITWPTVTVSPSWARISAIVPEAGAGSSMSTLSVEISTTVSPSLT